MRFRKLGFLLLVIALVIAGVLAFPVIRQYFSGGSANGDITSDPSAVPARFRVSFIPTHTDATVSLDLALDFCFTPRPATTVVVKAMDADSRVIPGTFSVYIPHDDSTVSSTTEALKLAVPEKPGIYRISFANADGKQFRVSMLVPTYVPDSASGYALGRRIGAYGNTASGPDDVRKYPSLYRPPKYFVEITPETETLSLSPRVKVGDLVALTSKENPTRHVNFAPVDYSLIAKIEAAWRVFSKTHPEIPQWRYISWFRTPAHNKGQGGATFSRHPYGDACDIIVDLDNDWRMDDINGDGKVNMADAVEIVSVFEELEFGGAVKIGGLGAYEYPGDESTGSSVHIDARGYFERWGFSWMSGRKRPLVWFKDYPK